MSDFPSNHFQTSLTMLHIPAITLYRHIKISLPFMTNFHKFWQASSFQVHTSVQKHLRDGSKLFPGCALYSLVASSQLKLAMFLSLPIKAVDLRYFRLLLPSNWTHEFAKIKYLRKLAAPLRSSEWTPVGMRARWWKCFHPKYTPLRQHRKLN